MVKIMVNITIKNYDQNCGQNYSQNYGYNHNQNNGHYGGPQKNLIAHKCDQQVNFTIRHPLDTRNRKFLPFWEGDRRPAMSFTSKTNKLCDD